MFLTLSKSTQTKINKCTEPTAKQILTRQAANQSRTFTEKFASQFLKNSVPIEYGMKEHIERESVAETPFTSVENTAGV